METILRLDRPETYKKPNNAVLLKGCSNKITPKVCYSAMLIDECLVQPSSKNFFQQQWEQKQKQTMYRKWEVMKHSSLDEMSLSYPSLPVQGMCVCNNNNKPPCHYLEAGDPKTVWQGSPTRKSGKQLKQKLGNPWRTLSYWLAP